VAILIHAMPGLLWMQAYWREMIASEQGAEQASVKQAEASE
jgi:hypothetical protein